MKKLLLICLLFCGFAGQHNLAWANNTEQNGLDFIIQPSKTHFYLTETVLLNVKAKQDFFLYLFKQDPLNNELALIYPNLRHQGNKFAAYQVSSVPTASLSSPRWTAR